MKLKCLLGLHTNIYESRYEFKYYNNNTNYFFKNSIIAGYYRSCGECGKYLKDQQFTFCWDEHLTTLPSSLKECVQKAKNFTSNK